MFKQMTTLYGDEFLTMTDEDGDVVFGERIQLSLSIAFVDRSNGRYV